jgi:hypothetical protein
MTQPARCPPGPVGYWNWLARSPAAYRGVRVLRHGLRPPATHAPLFP